MIELWLLAGMFRYIIMGVLINPYDNAVRVSLGMFRSVVLLCVGIDNRLGLGPLRLSISFFL